MFLRYPMRLLGQGLLLIQGAGAKQFLQGLITKDMDVLNNAQLTYAFLLNVRGRVLADIFVYRLDGIREEHYLLETSLEQIEPIEKALKLYRLRKKIKIEPLPDQSVYFSISNETQRDRENITWLPDPRVPNFGFRGISTTKCVQNLEKQEDSSMAYIQRRMQWGLGEGEEIAGQIPLNVNGDLTQAISFEKGCYIGQELVARSHHIGKVRRRLVPFNAIDHNGAADRSGDLRDVRGKRQGKILSSYGSNGGLCLVSLDILPPDLEPVRLFDSSGAEVEIRRPFWWPQMD